MVTDIKFLSGLRKSDHLVIDFNLLCYTEEEAGTHNQKKLKILKSQTETNTLFKVKVLQNRR